MFEVIRKTTQMEYTVYAVRDTGGEYGAEFLIFESWAWKWISANEFTPAQ